MSDHPELDQLAEKMTVGCQYRERDGSTKWTTKDLLGGRSYCDYSSSHICFHCNVILRKETSKIIEELRECFSCHSAIMQEYSPYRFGYKTKQFWKNLISDFSCKKCQKIVLEEKLCNLLNVGFDSELSKETTTNDDVDIDWLVGVFNRMIVDHDPYESLDFF